MKIIIMAGGSGTRLWPLSRKQKPKQFQKLLGDRTMLQESIDRLDPLVGLRDIFVATVAQYRDEVIAELPELPEENILIEPAKRDTAPAIGLSAILSSDDDTEPLIFLTADHYIQKKKEFRHLLDVASRCAQENSEYVVTLGITPTAPETGFGYIRFNPKVVGTYDGSAVQEVEAFVEKPNQETAQRYLQEGTYVWNSGMFIVTRGTILKAFQQFQPKTYSILKEIETAKGTSALQQVIESCYPDTEKISVDYGIMEKMPHIAVVPANIGWSDIGSWSALKEIVMEDSTTLKHLGQGDHFDVGSKGVLVRSDVPKLIATVGLEDVVIVETEDVLLVCDKNRSQDVKKIVELLETQNILDKL